MRFVHTASRVLPRWWLAFLLLGLGAIGSVRAADEAYTTLVGNANQLLKAGKLADARQLATSAILISPDRFEAYFIAGVVAHQQGADTDAQPLIKKALALAPDDKKPKIQRFLDTLGSATVAPTAAAVPAATPVPSGPPSLDATAQRKLDILTIIIQDADSSDSPDKRKELLGEFLNKSAPFLKEHPEQANIWVLRAVAAVELERERSAKRAGQKLQELGYGNSQDEKIRKVMAMLDRKGWLVPPGSAIPQSPDWPVAGKPFENTLGMKFVPVPGTDVLFSIWDTRVQDYQVFVQATSTGWPDPPFPQGPTHPAVNLSWFDAKKFCEWLTEKEQQAGRLGPNQAYRLPTIVEWSAAVGPDQYPWGDNWPPPNGAGNYRDTQYYEKYRDAEALKSDDYINDYDDGYADTSPVGSFTANKFGLYDMGGDVWQWCDDPPSNYPEDRVVRGASFKSNRILQDYQLSSYRLAITPGDSSSDCGFRCVLAMSPSEPEP